MSIEIDVLNGNASWKRTEPLHNAVFGKDIVEKLPWGHIGALPGLFGPPRV
jgi:aminoglycoside 2'-N-acetyltransferase I